jgi:hypothetical protein
MKTQPMPQTSNAAISLRKFGRSDAQISALGFGGHHLGEAPDEKTAVEIVHQAIDGGISFFDNCWEYRRGSSTIFQLCNNCRFNVGSSQSACDARD